MIYEKFGMTIILQFSQCNVKLPLPWWKQGNYPVIIIYGLEVMGPEATNGCQYYHICDGLKAAIDRAVHRVQAILGANLSTEHWGFLLVDAKKHV